MGLKTASLQLKIAVVFSLLAAVCHVTGFATDWWRRTTNGWFGLWNGCAVPEKESRGGQLYGVTFECAGINLTDDLTIKLYQAIRASEIIGLILLVSVLLSGIFYMVEDFMKRKGVRIFLILGSFLAVVAILTGVIIFGVVFISDSVSGHYSYALTIIGGIFALVSGIMYALDPAPIRQAPEHAPQELEKL